MKSPLPLKGFLSLQFGIVAVLPIITIACLVWIFMMPAMQTRTGIQQQAMARSIAGQISAHLKGGERQLIALAEYLQIRNLDSNKDLFRLLDAGCGKGEFFEALFITDSERIAIETVGLAQSRRSKRSDFMGLDLSGRSYIHTTKALSKAVWSKTFLSTVSSRMAVALTVPLADGFITGEITLDNLSEFISHLPVESEILTLVIDGQGIIVADSQKLRWGQVIDLNLIPKEAPDGGARFSSSAFELDGEQMLGTSVEMEEAGWKVLIAQPTRKAFKPLRDTLKLSAWGVTIALAIVLSISWLQAGKLSQLFQTYAERAQSIANGRYTLQWPKARTREFYQLGQSLQRMAEKIRRREKALIDSESHLQITLDSIGDAVIATNNQGVITRMNPMAEKLTGWSSDEAIGRPLTGVFQIINGFTRDPVENPVNRVLAEGEIVGLANHTVLIAKDGHEYQIADSGAPIRQTDGSFVGVVLVFRDVTETYAQERKIQENERRLRDLTRNVPGVVIQFHATRDHIYSNEFLSAKANEIFGLEPNSETILDDFFAHIPDTEKAAYAASMRESVDAVSPWTYEGRFNRPDGETIWFSGRAIPQDQGDVIVYYGILQDITERKRTEESLRITQFSFDSANIGIYRIDSDAQIREVNQKAAQLLGYDKEELQTMSIMDIDPLATSEVWGSVWEELLEQKIQFFQREHRRKDGSIMPVEVYGNLLEYEDQQYSIAFVQDITERKRMEAALKENEQRLDLALSGANEGIWDWRIDEDTIYFDLRYYTMAGYRFNEFPGAFDEFEKRLHKDDLERVKKAIAQYMAGDLETFAVEFRFLRKDGSYMWIQGKGRIVAWDDEGNPVRFVGTHADITERKQAEEALRENEQLLSNILESMNEGILVLDRDFKCKIFNRSLGNMVESTKEDAIGKIPWEAFPAVKDTSVEKNIKKTMAGESAGNLEIQLPLPSGKMAWFRDSFSYLKDADGHIVGVVGVVSDITQQKQSEEELRRLRNYLSNIIDSMPSILVAVDRDGNVTQWNNQTEQITGLSFEEAWAQPLAKVFPRLAGEMERIGTAIKERRVISSPKVPRTLEQETRFEDVTIFPLVANGVEGAVIRVDDVTEQVRLEEMMIQSEKMLTVGGLAAGMAHEINNPLAGMLQTAEVMALRLTTGFHIPANEKAAEAAGITLAAIEQFMEARGIPRMLDTITSSGRRVADIVDNMLSFARKDDAWVSSYRLDKILDKTVKLAATDYDLKKQYDFKRIKIVKAYADNMPAVPCLESKIQQVVLNILSNGAQAMQVSQIEKPQFTIRTYMDSNRNMACMEIEDNGPGMDETTCKHVFDPFFTTKQKGKGTGLGLSVSYFIITENHSGEMAVESRPGAGAKFIIRLPVERGR